MSLTPGLDAAVERSGLIKDARELARRAHLGQLRRGSDGRPYIEHPEAVAELLLKQSSTPKRWPSCCSSRAAARR